MAHEFIYTCYKLARHYPPDRTVLENISLSFYPGAKIGVIGSNGSGKSSLLRIMAGLDDGFSGDARLTLVESVFFGRSAFGESLTEASFRDRWRIRRGRRLLFAEDMRLDGDMTAALDRPAVGDGARANATFLHVAPDAEARLDEIRAILADAPCEWGASAWNGMALVRLLSPSPEKMRAAIVSMLQSFRGRDAPRVWQ